MGNSSGKESRGRGGDASRSGGNSRSVPGIAQPAGHASTHSDVAPTQRAHRSARARHDSSLFGLGGGDPAAEPRRETKPEREARRAEKERIARAMERERSLKEEGVDGGYLVTLGTYTGPEDFSKPIVRQLMIERRLAPFWRGLNDHSDSWTEYQLVAAAHGLPIPRPDETPQILSPQTTQSTVPPQTPIEQGSKPIGFRSPLQNAQGDASQYSTSHPTIPTHNSASGSPSTHPPLFRGRSKTLVTLGSTKPILSTELKPQEIQLPRDPYVHGQPLEAVLYKDASECPICFLYYPPYLNKTRCCDQSICSECFVQIKRPDPHPPEHADPTAPPPTEPQDPRDEEQLISEPATCPFCKQPEFGVSYEPPAFKRGLAYANGSRGMVSLGGSAMSSSTSLPSPTEGVIPVLNRRRATSLSANAPQVITTDKVRPDWATKLSDARAYAARRAAAATALHTAAYMLGGNGSSSGLSGGRRRRGLLGLEANRNIAAIPNLEALLTALEGQEAARTQRRDLLPNRTSSRGNRLDDVEEIMMMEAIRQSLAAEEERKRKEEKEAAKRAKKEEKERAKEQKKADKSSRGGWGSSFLSSSPASVASIPELPEDEGKGKARAPAGHDDNAPDANDLAISPISASGGLHTPIENPQRHLEQRRAQLGVDLPQHTRLRSGTTSSSDSSFIDSAPGFYRAGEHEHEHDLVAGSDSSLNASPSTSRPHLPFASQSSLSDAGSTGPPDVVAGTFSYASLAAMVGAQEQEGEREREADVAERFRRRGGSGESSASAPPRYDSQELYHDPAVDAERRGGGAAPPGVGQDRKYHGGYGVVDRAVDQHTA